MSNTRAQLRVEGWIRRTWLPSRFPQEFVSRSMRVPLTSGGEFEFDAVSTDGKIVANISTSGSKTARGKNAVGKLNKVRSDVYFLLLASATDRVMLLTERSMYDWWLRESERGRVPRCINFEHVAIPEDLDRELKESRKKASDEVTP